LRRCWLKGLGFYGPRGTGAFFEPVVVTEELRTVARLGSDYSNRTEPVHSIRRLDHLGWNDRGHLQRATSPSCWCYHAIIV